MKIGILGGTFDPVHKGHIYIAEQCMKHLGMDGIMFLPNGNPPHKRGRNITDKEHRYNMIKIAISGCEGFCVSDYEIRREEYSYTVETMRNLRKLSDDEYILIIGADSFYQLDLWYKSEELVKENKFVVLDREYDGHGNISEDVERFNKEHLSHISLLKIPLIDISSTEIRNRISMGTDISDMVGENVANYIFWWYNKMIH